jgi:hypothetical protein
MTKKFSPAKTNSHALAGEMTKVLVGFYIAVAIYKIKILELSS